MYLSRNDMWLVLFIVYLFVKTERGQFHGWILTSEEGCPLPTQGGGRGSGGGGGGGGGGGYANGRKKRALGWGNSRNENDYSALSSAECLKTCVKDENCYAFKHSGECNIWDLSKKSECLINTQGSEKILIKSTQCKNLHKLFFLFTL